MNVNDINSWAEAISTLPDKKFSTLMHLYLGEFKTPYNKQKLISQLAATVKSPDNLAAIISLLSNDDVKILTAIYFMPKLTQTALLSFFSTLIPLEQLYTKIMNLQERLLIYTQFDENSRADFYYINPLFLDALKPYFDINSILKISEVTSFSIEDSFSISPNFLLSVISYLKIHGCSCKADGTIKKNDLNRLELIFPGKQDCLQLLINALLNLNLLREGTKKLELDESRLKAFATLTAPQQNALLCAASVSRLSKDGLKKQAQLLLDTIASLPQNGGYTQDTLLRLAFMHGTYTDDGSALAKKSRFSMMLEAARSDSASSEALQNVQFLDRMICSAVELGLLKILGKDENQNYVFVPADAAPIFPPEQTPKVLNIDSTFTVSLMPGLPLSKLLPLASFMMIRKSGIVTDFEITRQSASAAFDDGWTPQAIFDEIQKYTNYDIPQNLKININEWYNSYSSAMLYNGFILKVSDSNISFAENNPNIKKYIKEKLAEGVYLLNIPTSFETSEISKFIDESGLEFLGQVKTNQPKVESVSFPLLRDGISIFKKTAPNAQTATKFPDQNAAAVLMGQLKSELAKMELSQFQQEVLQNRINSRLILSVEHLKSSFVRTELLDAQGTDFSGKCRLIEGAIRDEEMIEITIPSGDSGTSASYSQLMAKPLSITKQEGEAVFRAQIEPTGILETFIVSKITHLRRLRF